MARRTFLSLRSSGLASHPSTTQSTIHIHSPSRRRQHTRTRYDPARTQSPQVSTPEESAIMVVYGPPRGRPLKRFTCSSTGGRPRCLAAASGQPADGGVTQQAAPRATVPLTYTFLWFNRLCLNGARCIHPPGEKKTPRQNPQRTRVLQCTSVERADAYSRPTPLSHKQNGSLAKQTGRAWCPHR